MFVHRRIAVLTIIFSIFLSGGWFNNHSLANDNEEYYFKIDRGLNYLREVFDTVSRNYVDEVDPEVLSKAAIEGMLKSFDPYTVFFKDPGSQQMRMITRGKYGGVGMEISVQNDKVIVIAPMEGSPAKRAGIRAGDIIKKIDDEPTDRMNLQDASERLRGKIGEIVKIELERPGVTEAISLELKREEIVLKDVTYAEFVEPGTAYFRLSAFSDKAGKELRNAIQGLQSEQKIKRVILDLRGNPGGLLSAAVDVANVFLPPKKLVVSTRGSHEEEHHFMTKEYPLLPRQPLVVLVDGSSASASEIVAGAIQDLDRGVLVGTETFGKGLVQKVYPINRVQQAYLKITTAKYYVPSGRSIQKEDYKKGANIFVDRSDSLEYDKEVDFFTQNRRVVHGGGGIQPDIEITRGKMDRFLQNLIAKGLFFQFTVDYLTDHPQFNNDQELSINEKMAADFQQYVQERNFDYELEGEAHLNDFLKISREKRYDADIQDLVTVALQKLKAEKQHKFEENQEQIRKMLIAEFAEKSGGLKGRIKTTLRFDRQFQSALSVLRDHGEYREILATNQ